MTLLLILVATGVATTVGALFFARSRYTQTGGAAATPTLQPPEAPHGIASHASNATAKVAKAEAEALAAKEAEEARAAKAEAEARAAKQAEEARAAKAAAEALAAKEAEEARAAKAAAEALAAKEAEEARAAKAEAEARAARQAEADQRDQPAQALEQAPTATFAFSRPVSAPPEARPTASAPPTASQALEKSDPNHAKARRFARVAVSEIKLYHEREVSAGRAAKDLWKRLNQDIMMTIQAYEQRVPADVRNQFDYLYDELVRQLAEGKPELLGPDAPDSTANAAPLRR